METMLELSRHALEGVEVLFAFAVTGLLSLGLVHAHQAAARGGHGSAPTAPAPTRNAAPDL